MDVVRRLGELGQTVASAESLTGGMVASRITDVPGASRSFLGGVVAYATGVKQSLLGVDGRVLEQHGAVSSECAEAMAQGVRALLGATWGVSTTGVAGPGSQDGQPAGTVWIAVAGPSLTTSRRLALAGDRHRVREQTCDEVLALLQATLRATLQEEETRLR